MISNFWTPGAKYFTRILSSIDYILHKHKEVSMKEVTLNFNTEDTGLNLTGVVNFPERAVPVAGYPDVLTVRGLAEWRHVPANIVHVNERMLMNFNMVEKAKNFSKIGMNFIGIKAHSDILLSHSVRAGKNGTAKVQEQLTKFFKALGASSVKFSILNVDVEMNNQEVASDNNENDDN